MYIFIYIHKRIYNIYISNNNIYNYKSNQGKTKRGEDYTRKYYYEHYLSQNHNGFINDIKNIFINKTNPPDATRGDHFWGAKFKTLAPDGLIIKE